MASKYEILVGDCRDVLRTLPSDSVQCIVTSPPYFGLRDYGTGEWVGGDADCDHVEKQARNDVGDEDLARRAEKYSTGTGAHSKVSHMKYTKVCARCGAKRKDMQIGMEATPGEFVEALVQVFREARRVLRGDGTLWLNIGDSYNGGVNATWRAVQPDLKPKNLLGIPWRVAFALQDDGWILRQDIIWHKPNAMPESVRDRCTKAHEYLFLFSKRTRYTYHSEAIAEPIAHGDTGSRTARNTGIRFGGTKYGDSDDPHHNTMSGNEYVETGTRNKRSVWSIPTAGYKDAHFATFPPDLVLPCILAGSSVGDTVLDPFSGAGTTGLVANRRDRNYIGIELSPEYAQMSRDRIRGDAPLFAMLSEEQPCRI